MYKHSLRTVFQENNCALAVFFQLNASSSYYMQTGTTTINEWADGTHLPSQRVLNNLIKRQPLWYKGRRARLLEMASLRYNSDYSSGTTFEECLICIVIPEDLGRIDFVLVWYFSRVFIRLHKCTSCMDGEVGFNNMVGTLYLQCKSKFSYCTVTGCTVLNQTHGGRRQTPNAEKLPLCRVLNKKEEE